MKALFITDDFIIDPLGLGYLSSYLKAAGHSVEISKLLVPSYRQPLNAYDMLCYSVTTGKHRHFAEVNRHLNRSRDSVSVFGGPHPTFFPGFAKEDGVDVAVRGEGFDAIVDIANAIEAGNDIEGIPNTVVGDTIADLRPLKDKATLLHPDRELIYSFPENYHNPIKNVMCSFGCVYSCPYCVGEDTLVLMADGTSKPIKDIKVGDLIIGVDEHVVEKRHPRRYRETAVEAIWTTEKSAYEIELEDGTTIICSGEHRWLSRIGWLYTIGKYGRDSLGRFTRADRGLGTSIPKSILGMGGTFETAKASYDYRRGYLNGMIRGDGTLAVYKYPKKSGGIKRVDKCRITGKDEEALQRCVEYLSKDYGIEMRQRILQHKDRNPLPAIDTGKRDSVAKIQEILIPKTTEEFRRGFLAGIFDAEGHTQKTLSAFCFANSDKAILSEIREALEVFGFDHYTDNKGNGNFSVRVRGGLRETVRFFQLVNPAISRKFRMGGVSIRGNCRVKGIKALGETRRMYDITTSCGTFLANGYVSHNCYNSRYKELYAENTVQVRPVDDIFSEIQGLMQYEPHLLFFQDDIFPVYKSDWLDAFCEGYAGFNTPFHIQVRAEMLNEEVVSSLKDVGLHGVTFAIESGNDHLRETLLGRRMSRDVIIKAADMLHRYGIRLRTENMIGIPGETWQTAMETLDLNRQCQPSLAWASLFQPYPGTKLGDQCIADGSFSGDFNALSGDFFSTYRLDVKGAKRYERLQKLFSMLVSIPGLRRLAWPLSVLPLGGIYKRLYRWYKARRYSKVLYNTTG